MPNVTCANRARRLAGMSASQVPREAPQLVPTLPGGAQGAGEGPELAGLSTLQKQSVLAVGGMGSIVHAYDPTLERHVAVKVLHAELAGKAGEFEAFLREAKLTARLEHPNIVPVHEAAWDRAHNRACFEMRLVQGCSLGQRLKELGPERKSDRELAQLLTILLKVCDAVAFAHSIGVLHLDLKPDNVMLGSHGQVYVMDWGLAVRCAPDSNGHLKSVDPSPPRVRGSLAYMPPEQLEGGCSAVDQRSDVHALGAMLYEILTGCPPFRSRATEDSPTARVPSLPDVWELEHPLLEPSGLAEIALRALARDADERHATVEIFRQELERFNRGGGFFRARRFQPGELLMREGEPAAEAYIITDGTCDVFQERDGLRAHLGTVGRGDVVGEAALLSGGLRTASVVAVGPVITRVVTADALERELGDRGWLGVLVRRLADRFREVDDARAKMRAAQRTSPPST